MDRENWERDLGFHGERIGRDLGFQRERETKRVVGVGEGGSVLERELGERFVIKRERFGVNIDEIGVFWIIW